MTYKGYRINVYWTDKDWGYRFTVYDPEGKVAAESEAAYFYDDNALKEAKKIIDGLAGGAEQ
ncbi:hypothetical protein C806_00756 [Lachnospiraceae bacterium 3-1]|nr:hypothetical protein C806_00756 [Lachnospiraceae bacterium 3-1]